MLTCARYNNDDAAAAVAVVPYVCCAKENAYELMATPSSAVPGTFYIDRHEGTVYYLPNPGEDMAGATAFIPMLETLLASAGASNVTLEGIDFKHTWWGGADSSCGYVPMQAGWHPMSDACMHEQQQQQQQPPPQPATQPFTAPKGPKPPTYHPRATPPPPPPTPPPPLLPPPPHAFTPPPPYVMGAGGIEPGLNSKAGPTKLISRNGLASLQMQADANLCAWVYASANCTTTQCPRTQTYCVGIPVVPPAQPDARGYKPVQLNARACPPTQLRSRTPRRCTASPPSVSSRSGTVPPLCADIPPPARAQADNPTRCKRLHCRRCDQCSTMVCSGGVCTDGRVLPAAWRRRECLRPRRHLRHADRIARNDVVLTCRPSTNGTDAADPGGCRVQPHRRDCDQQVQLHQDGWCWS